MIKKSFIFPLALFIYSHLFAAEWQWSVKIKGFLSPETNQNPDAFLWIPSDCERVRAVAFGQHNMCEETIFEHPAFRERMSDLGFAVIWITPGIDQRWDISNDCQKYFETMMNDLAEVSGYSELKNVPVIPLGHSAMATFPWNFAAWNPDRTLAVISYHGDAPRTNLTGYGGDNMEWGRTRNIDGIPGLMIEGEYEWWEARVNPALAFRMMYPESCVSFLCDVGHGHFDVSDEVVNYISLFLKKAAQYRLTDNPTGLKKLNVHTGWLAERWSPNRTDRIQAAPFSEYKGDTHDAFWYFDKETALETEKYYARERGKKMRYIGIVRYGELLPFRKESHSQYDIPFEPEQDGVTFTLSAVFTDSLRRCLADEHSFKDRIQLSRICGPVQKINDSTFRVCFYRMGLNNNRRTGDIWLAAHHNGDEIYKSAVQQLHIRIPYPNNEGEEQHIAFPPLRNIKKGIKSVELKARTDSNLPVSFYIKEGPAKIEDGKLVLTKIPPRSRYPVKVTVVAWQYGQASGKKIQTATPVERNFYIEK